MNRSGVAGATALLTAVLLSACGPRMTGAVRDDTTLTGTSAKLKQTSDVAAYRGPRLRVGVVNFLNRTPSQATGLGESAADILGTILQRTDRFIVIPQQDIDALLRQQKFEAAGAADPETAAKMGRIMGLNAVVTGAVTAYSEAEEGADFIVGRMKKQIARVTVDYRIVDAETGVQLAADSGTGIYEKKVTTVMGAGGRAGYDPDLRDGALRDALTKAMVNMLDRLESRAWSGRIAQIEEGNLYINAGQRSGLLVGEKLDVFRAGREIIDPSTKMRLGTTENLIGQAVVVKNDLGDQMDLSLAAPSSGGGFRTGDIVRLSTR